MTSESNKPSEEGARYCPICGDDHTAEVVMKEATKEYWIYSSAFKDNNDCVLQSEPVGTHSSQFIHVIEYSAYEALKKELELTKASTARYDGSDGVEWYRIRESEYDAIKQRCEMLEKEMREMDRIDLKRYSELEQNREMILDAATKLQKDRDLLSAQNKILMKALYVLFGASLPKPYNNIVARALSEVDKLKEPKK